MMITLCAILLSLRVFVSCSKLYNLDNRVKITQIACKYKKNVVPLQEILTQQPKLY